MASYLRIVNHAKIKAYTVFKSFHTSTCILTNNKGTKVFNVLYHTPEACTIDMLLQMFVTDNIAHRSALSKHPGANVTVDKCEICTAGEVLHNTRCECTRTSEYH